MKRRRTSFPVAPGFLVRSSPALQLPFFHGVELPVIRQVDLYRHDRDVSVRERPFVRVFGGGFRIAEMPRQPVVVVASGVLSALKILPPESARLPARADAFDRFHRQAGYVHVQTQRHVRLHPHDRFDDPRNEVCGRREIGVFGMATPETATKAHPAKIQGVTFPAGQAMFDIAQKEVEALKAEGCDYIVCLGHLGIDDESAGNRSFDLLEKVEGIDVFIDGHSHSTLEEVKEITDGLHFKTCLTSTGTKLASIGVVTIAPDGTITLENVSTEGLAEDETVAARAAAIQKEIDDDYGAVFAKTDVELNGERDPGNRTQETNLGDLITDALVWGAEKNGETVDLAITNGGGIRAAIKAGDITKKDVNTVLPFGNTLSIVKVTGAELLEALEASTYCTPTAVGGFPQVSGIDFEVDTTKAFDEGDLYPGSTYHKPASINRVTITQVNGKDFDLKATYTIATNDFMAAGGDTYYAFASASVNYDLGIPMDEILMDYIKEELGGTVTAGLYAEPATRIMIKYAETEETPAEEPATEPVPEPVPEPAPEPVPAPEPEPAPAPVVPEGSYVVKAGDCLWSIAQRTYGNGAKWTVIYEANKTTMKDADTLSIGQILVLPAA